jgi:hypothetical protein
MSVNRFDQLAKTKVLELSWYKRIVHINIFNEGSHVRIGETYPMPVDNGKVRRHYEVSFKNNKDGKVTTVLIVVDIGMCLDKDREIVARMLEFHIALLEIEPKFLNPVKFQNQ